ncbi:MAG: hypothetical protein Q9159_002901 [Coniocarpon cinnabarinum]
MHRTAAKVSPSPNPPPFSSLHFPSTVSQPNYKDEESFEHQLEAPPAFTEHASDPQTSSSSTADNDTKAELPQDFKDPAGLKDLDDGEPPPPYTEGSSPLEGFTYVMAAAGGASSIITQVSQGAGGPLNALSGVSADENINIDLRGTRFSISRDELLTLPEFVLLSLFPNGLLPEGHLNAFQEGDVYPVDVSIPSSPSSSFCSFPKFGPMSPVSGMSSSMPRARASIGSIRAQLADHEYMMPNFYLFESQYDPISLQYMLDFFRNVAQSMPSRSPSPANEGEQAAPEPAPGSAQQMLQDRAGIIVLREDLDYYVIPPQKNIQHHEMVEVKRAAGKALLQQNGIFSGLRKSEEAGSTEQHLIEMLTAGGFNHSDTWGHRAGEPNKAVICSIALARLRTDVKNAGISGGGANPSADSNAVGMAQKLLLFWRKPARRCWWEGVDLSNVEGVPGDLKVWVRRVWTLEMSVIGLR